LNNAASVSIGSESGFLAEHLENNQRRSRG